MAEAAEAVQECGVTLTPFDQLARADTLADSVALREYQALSVEDLGRRKLNGGAFIDMKAVYAPAPLSATGLKVLRL